MIRTFKDIKDAVFRAMGLDPDDIDTSTENEIENRINVLQDNIFFDRDWEWRQFKIYLTTKKPYETGTVTLTQNSRTVTGSGTVWTDVMKDGYLLIDSLRFKVRSVDSVSQISLEAPYPNETESSKSYKIIFPDYRLDPRINAILDISNEGRSIKAVNELRLVHDTGSTGYPEEASVSNRTSEDFYNAGQVDMTNDDTAVTGVGTTFTSDMEGMEFRVNEFIDPYVIREVTSSTELVLDRAYQGESGQGKNYKIGPAGSQMITFSPAPDDYYFLEISGLLVPRRLVNNTDISLIPNHGPLFHGAIWFCITDYENKNPVRIQQARADYERTLDQLRSSYRVITGVRWRSEQEYGDRRRGGQTRFNPLED